MRERSRLRTSALVVGALLILLSIGWLVMPLAPAQACGGFFRPQRAGEKTRAPSLAYEQTLIAFDAERRSEHFIREVVFRDSTEPFGFVVPTPARPSVAAIKKSPFAELDRAFPFEVRPRLTAMRSRAGGGAAPSKSPGGHVQVLEKRQVGSFTSFVLAADDDQALAGWLTQNGFATTKPTEAWLSHYVNLKFFYVAMRYEPRGAEAGKTIAETVSISFDAPLPYYPYLEPEKEPGGPRMLDVWLVAKRRYLPVAVQQQAGRSLWVQPLKGGLVFDPLQTPRAALVKALATDQNVLPPGDDLFVQRFADQKRSRQGFGDVVFVPDGEPRLNDDERSKLVSFVPLLDPSLGETP